VFSCSIKTVSPVFFVFGLLNASSGVFSAGARSAHPALFMGDVYIQRDFERQPKRPKPGVFSAVY
jgi:hypothetical protein